MKVILVDDEELALDIMEILLSEIEGIDIVGRFTDPYEILYQIKDLEVDVVFLDIEMGKMNGLQIAEELISKKGDLEIVFITAYSQYAVEAFEVNAIDYLLKPVEKKRLEKTIRKLEKTLKEVEYRKRAEVNNHNKIYLYCMGNFQLFTSQQVEVKWRTKKVKELFAYLWHYRKHPTYRSRMRIIEELWPEITLDKSTALLNTTIYQLRSILRKLGYSEPIILHNAQYNLNLPMKSDLEDLEERFKETELTNSKIEEILRIYRGDYLEEECYVWSMDEQERIRQLLIQYLERYTKKIQLESAINPLLETILEKIVEMDIYSEKKASTLIHYYGKTNQKSKLVHFFQRYQNLLEYDLGVPLSEELCYLYQNYIKG